MSITVGVAHPRNGYPARSKRIEEAKRLLRDPRSAHRRISDIAYAVGFQDLSYFNRAFRQRTGGTPSAARRRS